MKKKLFLILLLKSNSINTHLDITKNITNHIEDLNIKNNYYIKECVEFLLFDENKKTSNNKNIKTTEEIIQYFKVNLEPLNKTNEINLILNKIKNEEIFIENNEIHNLILSSKLDRQAKKNLLLKLKTIKENFHKISINNRIIEYLDNSLKSKNMLSYSRIAFLMHICEFKEILMTYLLKIWAYKESIIYTTYEASELSTSDFVYQFFLELNLIKEFFLENQQSFELLQSLIISSLNCYSQYFVYFSEDNTPVHYTHNRETNFSNKLPDKIYKLDIFQNVYEKNIKKIIKYQNTDNNTQPQLKKNSNIMTEIYLEILQELNKTIRYPVVEILSLDSEVIENNLIKNIFQQITEETIEKTLKEDLSIQNWFNILILKTKEFENLKNKMTKDIEYKTHEFVKNNKENNELPSKYYKLNKINKKQREKILKLKKINKSKKNDVLIISSMIFTIFMAILIKYKKNRIIHTYKI